MATDAASAVRELAAHRAEAVGVVRFAGALVLVGPSLALVGRWSAQATAVANPIMSRAEIRTTLMRLNMPILTLILSVTPARLAVGFGLKRTPGRAANTASASPQGAASGPGPCRWTGGSPASIHVVVVCPTQRMELGAKGQDGPADSCRLAWVKTVTARCGPVICRRRLRFWPQQILIAF